MEKYEQERIYDLYFDTVYKVCFLYMKNHADAQDLTQETFCQMLRKPFHYESDEKAKAWLIVSASNLCKNQLKKWWMRKIVSYDDSIGDSLAGLDDLAGTQGEVLNEIYQTVMGLDKKYAIPTYLYYYEGYTTAEIANLLEVNQSTIQTRLAKARKLLRLEFDEA